ncbi:MULTISPECIES: zinc-finger domain-containing protein [unclassified Geobacillus]|uniref:zinc-finger domain-containing protein n=1 Tax=unclassified Geobacillus TaxID=2642459 RepID=UPI000C28C72B|nr:MULTISPECIES: zinc-finger domain-containing protein [unclassified Geobacillus]PJW14741.1 zinc-finger domain-containing protein [Geobacillus sp. Manikaran-105]PJW16994.1 zinc-finger domain-containing protein [Geobacillus sp. WSUCF-018B]
MGKKRNRRKEILDQIAWLEETYCDGCFLKSAFRKEYGKTYAQSFCIQQCTVGEQMRQYGEMLLSAPARPRR